MHAILPLSYHFLKEDNMLIPDRDYRWDTEEGLSIKWNGQWNKIEVPGYSPVELLGAGANGVTYKAFHQVTDRYSCRNASSSPSAIRDIKRSPSMSPASRPSLRLIISNNSMD